MNVFLCFFVKELYFWWGIVRKVKRVKGKVEKILKEKIGKILWLKIRVRSCFMDVFLCICVKELYLWWGIVRKVKRVKGKV